MPDPDNRIQARTTTAEPIHGTEDAAGALAPSPAATSPLGALIASHVLQDGEIVLLVLKPSLWFILTNSLRFIAGVLIFLIGVQLLEDRFEYDYTWRAYAEMGVFLIGGSLVWSLLQWTGRMYVLTDLRVMRLAGVFKVEVAACPLRKVARTRLTRTMRERLLRLGSIEILPAAEADLPDFTWQTIARPHQVRDQIIDAINRSRHSNR
jgi:hypothetical protein